ncbi:MAG: DUF1871 domain-containing protein [Sedimentibacter sp.]|uniref:DUF1871 domain-containing protein n=1 Tax=Sedimentibacter sp. TaxID=1960295 RepID=UPI00315889D6
MINRNTIFKIVKKEIDEFNLFDLLPEAPSDEFDSESETIASQIDVNSTTEEIAAIIANIFSKTFSEKFSQKDFMMTAEKIYKLLKDM